MIQTIRLTPKEFDVVLHRAYQLEAITEVFSEQENVWGLTDPEEVLVKVEAALIEMLINAPNKGKEIAFNPDNAGHVAVLIELLEGNTTGYAADDYMAFATSEPEYRIGVALRRACKAVERKFHAAGISATIP